MPASKHHIVIYTTVQADHGGVARNLIQQVQYLSEHYRFTVLAPLSTSLSQQIEAMGGQWENILVPPSFSWRAIRDLARRLKGDLAADIIYTLDPRACTVGCLAGKLARIPTVHCHSVSPLNYQHTHGARYWGYALGEAVLGWGFIDAGIFVAEHVRQHYFKLHLVPRKSSYYIPNSIDPIFCQEVHSQREAIRHHLSISPETFLWVHLGTLTYPKAHEVILNAAHQLPDDRPWEMLFIGDGVLRESIQAQIEQLNLSDRVHLLNALPHEQALEILAAADGLVFPSRYENMPNTVLEAMALGVPSIVTPVGDSWRMVGEGDLPAAGLCVPVEDVPALTQAMIRLMTDAALYAQCQAAGAPRAAPFTVERTIEGMDAVFRKLLA